MKTIWRRWRGSWQHWRNGCEVCDKQFLIHEPLEEVEKHELSCRVHEAALEELLEWMMRNPDDLITVVAKDIVNRINTEYGETIITRIKIPKERP